MKNTVRSTLLVVLLLFLGTATTTKQTAPQLGLTGPATVQKCCTSPIPPPPPPWNK